MSPTTGATSVNYGERFRTGKRISTGLVESAINQIADKRVDKRQSMRWTPRGAHLLLQTQLMFSTATSINSSAAIPPDRLQAGRPQAMRYKIRELRCRLLPTQVGAVFMPVWCAHVVRPSSTGIHRLPGIESSRLRVYGCSGAANTCAVSLCSTIRPCYITATPRTNLCRHPQIMCRCMATT
jgi:hypothetical protein